VTDVAGRPDPGPARFELGTDGPSVVVVGVDGSPTSLRAGAYAAGLACRQHARLVVVHVLTVPVLASLAAAQPWPVEETLADVAEEVRREVTAGGTQAGVCAEFVVARGEPFAELCRVATELRADTVVVGASAWPGRRLTGSLAVRLVRCGRWPVTVVP
jgi:nucleotide-binding universal stress UspA family protein